MTDYSRFTPRLARTLTVLLASFIPLVLLSLTLVNSAAAQETTPPVGAPPEGAPPVGVPPADLPYASSQALYIPMRDGVQIAIDVYLPVTDAETVPTILRSTRYVRMFDRMQPTGEDLGFLLSGYALVLVDARGSGASEGTRAAELAPEEIADLGEVVDWIAAQPWSNGRVGAYGVSYDGDSAEMSVVSGHPALRISAPLYADFDVAELFAPGGLINDMFGANWGTSIAALDANDICTLAGVEPGAACDTVREVYSSGIKPVDADPEGEHLAEIVAARDNVDVAALTANAQFWDDMLATESTMYSGAYLYGDEITAANVPMLVWVGWLDAATADGALARFLTYDNPQIVVITPYSHGGVYDVNPYNPADAPLTESSEQQFMQRLAYFDALLKGGEAISERSITYYTFGSNTWATTDVWPPTGFETPTRWYLGADGALVELAPTEQSGVDTYTVDYSTTTGTANRWYAQLGSDVVYNGFNDAGLLTYTSAPFDYPVQITGAPEIRLQLASTHEDGALYVYLEDVAPDGTVTYLTEGVMRLGLRQAYTPETAPYQTTWLRHDPMSSAFMPLVPGETTEIALHLFNTSVRIDAGHQIRIAIAGADADTFRRYPAEGTPTLTIERNAAALSYVDLPMQTQP